MSTRFRVAELLLSWQCPFPSHVVSLTPSKDLAYYPRTASPTRTLRVPQVHVPNRSHDNADQPHDPSQDPARPAPLEMAYVLFMDIVSYSRMFTDEQSRTVSQLQRVVRDTTVFQRACAQNSVLSLPTGDGMALVFFGDPQSPVQCAVEVSRALRVVSQIPVRMGMHAGPIYRTVDITGKENVAGDGINMAQRVMDCGDAGHILVSKSLAEVLRQLSSWHGTLVDLGETTVKHGVRVHVFNLQVQDVGNPELPKKFQKVPAPASQEVRGWLLAGVVAFLFLAAAVTFVMRTVWFPHMFRKPLVAVLGFDNMRQRPDTEWASTLMDERITTELDAGETINTVPGETVARVKREMALQPGVTYGSETLQRLHKALGCDYIVYGSMDHSGGQMGGPVRFDIHLQDVNSGDMLTSITESESEPKLSLLAERVGRTLRAHLKVPDVSPADRKYIEASFPTNQDARKAYFDGLRQLRSFDLLSARESFQKSIAAESAFPLSHAYLAEVWSQLGYDECSKAEAKQAFDLSHNLLREDQIVVEARYRESISEWDKAVDLYRTLWNFSQAQPEYALRATDVQVRAGKATDALATLAELRQKSPDFADDPRIDLRAAEAYEALGDPRKEADAAKAAASKAHSTGAHLLEAEAEWRVCGGLKDVGDTGNAAAACNRSIELAKATGDELLVARGLTNLGHVFEAQNDAAQALPLHHQALEVASKLGSQRDVVGALGNIGDILSNQGDHPAAEQSYSKALAVATEINDRPAILLLQNDLAGEKEVDADFTAAVDLYQKSLDTAVAIGAQTGEINARGNLARLQLLRGDLLSAFKNAQQALLLCDQLGLQEKSAMLREILGDVLLAQAKSADAEKSYRDALDISHKLKNPLAIASAELALASFAAQTENWSDAVQFAQGAADKLKGQNPDMQASAYLVLANAASAQKRFPDAQSALNQAQSLKSSDPTIQLEIALTSARLLACTEKIPSAQKQAAEATAHAREIGLAYFQLRGALVTGAFGLCGAPRAQSRSLLHTVQVTASSQGYELIARQAAHTLDQIP